MTFNVVDNSRERDEVIIVISGELDIFTIGEVMNKIDELTVRTCILDFSGVTFIDSSGIGFVLRKIMDWQEEGRSLTFINLQPAVHEVMEEMGAFLILEEVLK
ncbi:STAS domain-containing protein [Falsibacillus pallidus]|uniref:Stage II sporulation protein AA (Anti-sigma F factor antagonist) n=1 Tax=Falsibacillus pallidus TaxID=493781 RepID=A0A370G8B6_9BACI|nr:STAS domain-containing protein [Falsibacillus pallidus]RDI40045.1 stage II sporulation protein AA (anti-sigma F factor antagonist) [Falsibacillus pallidus]